MDIDGQKGGKNGKKVKAGSSNLDIQLAQDVLLTSGNESLITNNKTAPKIEEKDKLGKNQYNILDENSLRFKNENVT